MSVFPDEILRHIRDYWPALNVLARTCQRLSVGLPAPSDYACTRVELPICMESPIMTISALPNGVRHGTSRYSDGNTNIVVRYGRGAATYAFHEDYHGPHRQYAVEIGPVRIVISVDGYSVVNVLATGRYGDMSVQFVRGRYARIKTAVVTAWSAYKMDFVYRALLSADEMGETDEMAKIWTRDIVPLIADHAPFGRQNGLLPYPLGHRMHIPRHCLRLMCAHVHVLGRAQLHFLSRVVQINF